jgi:hypothetical protein
MSYRRLARGEKGYLTALGEFVSDPEQAHAFDSAQAILDLCARQHLKGIEMVLISPDLQEEIAIPIS